MARRPNLPKTFQSEWRTVREQQRVSGAASRLVNSGMSVTGPGQYEIDGTVTVTGDFVAEGKVSNDALTNPTAGGYAYLTATNFPLTTAGANLISSSITVPPGFTQCVASMTGRVFAINNTTALDYLYARVSINGFTGYALPLAATANGGSCMNVAPFSVVLSGLTPGSTFALNLWAFTAFAGWPTNTSNTAEISGSLLWFR